jgi:hypothetical protein
MVKPLKSEPIYIPEAARNPKPRFPTRERADAEIPKIHKHIATEGKTYTYPGHTHTKPPKGAEPVYIGEFTMPKHLPRSLRYAPCPCCCDHFGKFMSGMIAWFPAERVIRLIGPDCFRTLSPEGHDKAKRAYLQEQEAKRDRDFLLSNIPKLARALRSIEKAAEVAAAVEQFHLALHQSLKRQGISLWRHVRDGGSLKVWGKSKELRQDSDGTPRVHEVEALMPKYRLHGYQMLEEVPKRLSRPLADCAARLLPFDFGDGWKAAVEKMDDAATSEACDVINTSISEAEGLIAEVRDLRRFVEPVNINTLKKWGENSACPVKVHFAMQFERVSLGKYEGRSESVDIPRGTATEIDPLDFWVPRSVPKRRAGLIPRRPSGATPSLATMR